jgi:hypothetical protein
MLHETLFMGVRAALRRLSSVISRNDVEKLFVCREVFLDKEGHLRCHLDILHAPTQIIPTPTPR